MNIELDEYEAVNLLWLLKDIVGWGAPGVEPFTMAHTGDWTGQIAQKIMAHGPFKHPPNTTVEEMQRRVQHWATPNHFKAKP